MIHILSAVQCLPVETASHLYDRLSIVDFAVLVIFQLNQLISNSSCIATMAQAGGLLHRSTIQRLIPFNLYSTSSRRRPHQSAWWHNNELTRADNTAVAAARTSQQKIQRENFIYLEDDDWARELYTSQKPIVRVLTWTMGSRVSRHLRCWCSVISSFLQFFFLGFFIVPNSTGFSLLMKKRNRKASLFLDGIYQRFRKLQSYVRLNVLCDALQQSHQSIM